MPLVGGTLLALFLLHSLVVFAVNVVDELFKHILLIPFEAEVSLDFGVD